jgi:hypothetical protein
MKCSKESDIDLWVPLGRIDGFEKSEDEEWRMECALHDR